MINYMTIQHNSLPKDGMKYVDLNAILNMLEKTRDGRQLYQLDKEKEAVEAFINDYVTPRMMKFDSYAERVHYLVDEGYYSGDVLRQYDDEFMESLRSQLEKVGFEFKSFIGALKFYKQYALKTWESNVNEEVFLEDYKDRATIVALYLAGGDKEIAFDIAREIISGRFQPATPTYLNSGRNDSGELVSCFPAGTPIDTIEGQVSIEDIEPGDMVLSHDGGYHEVEELIENSNDKNLVSIRHAGNKLALVCTPEHPVLVKANREIESVIDGDGSDDKNQIIWIHAEDIELSDKVVLSGESTKNYSFGEVIQVQELDYKPEKVYNLHVKDTHTYSVRGVIVHNCYLLRTEDNMESIGQTVTRSLQLSKRGGGVGICLTNLREVRGSIKGFKGLASGPVPVMKILEDSFSYADQLG